MLQQSLLLFYSWASYTRHTHVYTHTRTCTHAYTHTCTHAASSLPGKPGYHPPEFNPTPLEEPSRNQLGKFCWNSSQDSSPGPATTQKIFTFWQIPLQACFHTVASHEWKYQLEPGKSNTITQSAGVNSDLITSNYPSSQDCNNGLLGGHLTCSLEGKGMVTKDRVGIGQVWWQP